MGTFENTVVIQRPIGTVFAFLADFENVPAWNHAIESTTKSSPGPVGVGTTYLQTRSVPTRSEEGFEVTAFEPVSRLAIDGTIGPFRARSSYVLTPVGDATKLTNHVDLQPSSRVLGFAARLAFPRVKAAVDENLDTLKQTLETGGQPVVRTSLYPDRRRSPMSRGSVPKVTR
jgi:uncharacterized protein YndB with AHSA1/START domain